MPPSAKCGTGSSSRSCDATVHARFPIFATSRRTSPIVCFVFTVFLTILFEKGARRGLQSLCDLRGTYLWLVRTNDESFQCGLFIRGGGSAHLNCRTGKSFRRLDLRSARDPQVAGREEALERVGAPPAAGRHPGTLACPFVRSGRDAVQLCRCHNDVPSYWTVLGSIYARSARRSLTAIHPEIGGLADNALEIS